jgi:adenosylcobinamide kinase/adenosylcobinamide-phosphate guanylyltransferase
MGALWFVTGGARSGKSAFAERLARAAERPVVLVATMQPFDDELVRRVARHRAARPADWSTVEAPLGLVPAFEALDGAACVLLDCLSLWVSNRLLALDDDPTLDAIDELEAQLDGDLDRLLATIAARGGPTIVVTNEVGSGLVPPYPLGRAYRDLLGRVNQRTAAAAERAWLLVSGRPLALPLDDPPLP